MTLSTQTFKDLADAIRELTGSNETMTIEQMVAKVQDAAENGVSGGGSSGGSGGTPVSGGYLTEIAFDTDTFVPGGEYYDGSMVKTNSIGKVEAGSTVTIKDIPLNDRTHMVCFFGHPYSDDRICTEDIVGMIGFSKDYSEGTRIDAEGDSVEYDHDIEIETGATSYNISFTVPEWAGLAYLGIDVPLTSDPDPETRTYIATCRVAAETPTEVKGVYAYDKDEWFTEEIGETDAEELGTVMKGQCLTITGFPSNPADESIYVMAISGDTQDVADKLNNWSEENFQGWVRIDGDEVVDGGGSFIDYTDSVHICFRDSDTLGITVPDAGNYEYLVVETCTNDTNTESGSSIYRCAVFKAVGSFSDNGSSDEPSGGTTINAVTTSSPISMMKSVMPKIDLDIDEFTQFESENSGIRVYLTLFAGDIPDSDDPDTPVTVKVTSDYNGEDDGFPLVAGLYRYTNRGYNQWSWQRNGDTVGFEKVDGTEDEWSVSLTRPDYCQNPYAVILAAPMGQYDSVRVFTEEITGFTVTEIHSDMKCSWIMPSIYENHPLKIVDFATPVGVYGSYGQHTLAYSRSYPDAHGRTLVDHIPDLGACPTLKTIIHSAMSPKYMSYPVIDGAMDLRDEWFGGAGIQRMYTATDRLTEIKVLGVEFVTDTDPGCNHLNGGFGFTFGDRTPGSISGSHHCTAMLSNLYTDGLAEKDLTGDYSESNSYAVPDGFDPAYSIHMVPSGKYPGRADITVTLPADVKSFYFDVGDSDASYGVLFWD